MKVGDRVKILAKGIFLFKNRKTIPTGVITNINGENVLVIPSWYKFQMHLYKNEIELIK